MHEPTRGSLFCHTLPSPLRSRIRKYRLPILACAIILAGLAAGRWGYVETRDQLLTSLISDAKRAASAFDAAEMSQLTGTSADVDSPAYAAVKTRLRRYGEADAGVHFVYIFRALREQKQVIFLADSEPPGSPDISLPGDDYPEAATSPGLQSILRNGLPATEGPIKDAFGTWVTGYALVARDSDGEVRDILGVDMAASHWWWQIWSAGVKATLYVWLLFGLSLAGYTILRRQQEQNEVIRNLSEAIEQSHTAVMIIDLQGRIEYANHGFCQQVGYSRRDLIGKPWRDFTRETIPAETATEVAAIFYARRNWSGEWMNSRQDGDRYPVRGIITAVRNREEHVTCFVAIYEDLSDVRRNEAILREAKEQAEAGDRAKSHFLATMSHEVRTPLNGIVGFTNLLLETPLNAEQEEYMRTIRSSGEALIQLTNDILDSARIETGKLKLELHPTDPRECLEDALDMMATRASEKHLELLYRIEDDVPKSVMIDGGRLRQVLLNLVGNAVKFTEAGEITITVKSRALPATEEHPKGRCEITYAVHDTGIGIDPAKFEKLFRPFSQLETSSTRRYNGAGLGLAISSNLVQLMGGSINVQSAPGSGSTFSFNILAEEAAPLVEKAVVPHNIAGLRVAVAAEPGVLRDELCRMCGEWGAKVTACTAEELSATSWDTALVNITDKLAEELIAQNGLQSNLPREKLIALVPLGLSPANRAALRPHFRLLVNKPAHHEALRSALATPPAGSTPLPFAKNNAFDLHVLLVEDNPVNQLLMQKVLGHFGCQWTVAENGQIALEELKRNDYHLVLMDLHMPEMDGYTAIQKIREGAAGENMQQVWITALTADARTEQRDRVMEAGANDYLLKPVRLKDMEAMMRRFNAHRNPESPA